MTCDELFELLTAERSAGDFSCREAMKRHLAECRSCRRLADALEPAVELFRECSAGESPSSPLYDGPWNAPAARVHSQVNEQEAPFSHLLTGDRPGSPLAEIVGSDLLRLAAAILIGLTLGALFWGQSQSPQASAEPGSLAMSALPLDAGPVGRTRLALASLRITPACLPAEHRPVYSPGSPGIRPASELLAASNLDALACCTSCHASLGLAPHSRSATLHVVQSCQACHTFGS